MTMTHHSTLRRALSPLAAAAITALCVPLSAHAQSVTFNNLSAVGSYALNNASATLLADTISGAGSVDVLSFPSAGVNSAGLHSYGSSGGNFGSRSSGTGVYDVTGAFTIKLTLKNDQATAQQVNFAFYITPGYLNVTPLPLTGSQFVEAGVSFNIATTNGKSFNSSAMLRDDSSGVSFASTGTDLYGGSGASRSVLGGNHDLDLGVLNAGESVDLVYTLSSYAKGDAVLGTTTTVPAYQEVIPAHWVEFSDCGNYATLTKTGGDVAQVLDRMVAETDAVVGGCTLTRTLVPEQIIDIAAQTYTDGTVGGSQGSSGDPFSFNLNGNQQLSLPQGQNSPFSLQLSPAGADVPEPAGLALVATALAALALMRRRRSA